MKLNLACLLLLFAVSAAFSQEAQKTAPLAPPITIAPLVPAPTVPAPVAPPVPAPAATPAPPPVAPPIPAPPAPVAPPASAALLQESPKKLAIYVLGASDTSINKSLGSKLLVAMTQGGEYAGIADPGSFQDEMDKSGKIDTSQISHAAKQHSADYVCVVNMVEIFGTYSITAHLIKIDNSQVVKIGFANHLLKSLDDLTMVSNELARQLLPPPAVATPVAAPAATHATPPVASPVAPPVAAGDNLINPSLDAAAKDAAKSESETGGGLGWRGITRIAVFSAAAILSGATV